MKKSIYIALITIFVPYALLSVDISGTISGVWTQANSPYDLVGDATVPANETLTISPGVIVRAMGNFRITVAGTITANGTPADSIKFINGQTNPNALWKGIRLENTSLPSTFSYCYIENGEYGINSIASPVNISYSHFNRNTKGIHAYGIGTANPGAVDVSYSLIEYSGENGILISQNSNTNIQYCDISNNGVSSTYRGAIQLANQSAGGSNNPTIAYNHIHHNRWQGITAWDIVGANAINPFIHDNIIEYNLTGIYLLNASGYVHDNIIRYNFIPGDMNSGAGVMVSGATSEPYFERNIITNNFTGFYITNNAMPVLGDLSIYHAWAQGENVIRENVDAQGVPHSVVCASYPQNGNVIKAENNYWDFNDAAGIAEYITDGVDNPALPIVDFEPFLIYSEGIDIIGNFVNGSSHAISEAHIQLISVADGEIMHQELLPANGLIELNLDVTEAFYAIVRVILEGTGDTYRWACAGSLSAPQVFAPAEVINLGTITLTNEIPKYYETIGAPVSQGGLNVYPLTHQFFVYRFDSIDWLYRSGDYIYTKSHTRREGEDIVHYELPDGSIFMKVANLEDGEVWMKTIVDHSGTIQPNVVTHYEVFYPPTGFPFPGESHLMIQADYNGNIVSETLFDPNFYQTINQHRYFYDGDLPTSAYSMGLERVGTDYSIFPVLEGNRWKNIENEFNYAAPSMLVMNLSWEFDAVRLHWQAPVVTDTLWTGYRIYLNDNLLAEVPYSQRMYLHSDAGILIDSRVYWVVATDGVNESAISNYAAIGPSNIQDDLTPAVKPKLGPNPFSPGRHGNITFEAVYPSKGNTTISIFNLRGQRVHEFTIRNESCIQYKWDGRDQQNLACPTGIYFLEIKRDSRISHRQKFTLLK